MDILKLFQNHILNIAAICWFSAQILKVIISLIFDKNFDFTRFLGSGGMPSSHSAFVSGMSIAVWKYCGFTSIYMALAVVISLVVMFDAVGVRRAAGEQAKILNRIVNEWNIQDNKQRQEELKELLGHTKTEVFAGMVLGVAIGLIYTSIIPHIHF